MLQTSNTVEVVNVSAKVQKFTDPMFVDAPGFVLMESASTGKTYTLSRPMFDRGLARYGGWLRRASMWRAQQEVSAAPVPSEDDAEVSWHMEPPANLPEANADAETPPPDPDAPPDWTHRYNGEPASIVREEGNRVVVQVQGRANPTSMLRITWEKLSRPVAEEPSEPQGETPPDNASEPPEA